MPGNNAASRLHALAEEATRVRGSVSMAEGLTKLFAYDPKDLEREHARRIEAWRVQVDTVRMQLRVNHFPEELYDRWLRQLEDVLQPALLRQSFDTFKAAVSESVRLCLQWCAYALPNEEVIEGEEELGYLLGVLRELLSSPELAALPGWMQELFATHLNAVLEGAELARIDGGGQLRKAVRSAFVDLTATAKDVDEVAEKSTSSQRSFIAKVGQTIKKGAEVAASTGKAFDGIEKVWKIAAEHGPAALEWGRKLLGSDGA